MGLSVCIKMLIFWEAIRFGQVFDGKIGSVYFGEFKKKERIISYAASLANGKIAESEEAAFVKLLKNVDAISVREEKLAEQLRQLM